MLQSNVLALQHMGLKITVPKPAKEAVIKEVRRKRLDRPHPAAKLTKKAEENQVESTEGAQSSRR